MPPKQAHQPSASAAQEDVLVQATIYEAGGLPPPSNQQKITQPLPQESQQQALTTASLGQHRSSSLEAYKWSWASIPTNSSASPSVSVRSSTALSFSSADDAGCGKAKGEKEQSHCPAEGSLKASASASLYTSAVAELNETKEQEPQAQTTKKEASEGYEEQKAKDDSSSNKEATATPTPASPPPTAPPTCPFTASQLASDDPYAHHYVTNAAFRRMYDRALSYPRGIAPAYHPLPPGVPVPEGGIREVTERMGREGQPYDLRVGPFGVAHSAVAGRGGGGGAPTVMGTVFMTAREGGSGSLEESFVTAVEEMDGDTEEDEDEVEERRRVGKGGRKRGMDCEEGGGKRRRVGERKE